MFARVSRSQRLSGFSNIAYFFDAARVVNLFYNVGQVFVNVWLLYNVVTQNGASEHAVLLAGNRTDAQMLYNLTQADRIARQTAWQLYTPEERAALDLDVAYFEEPPVLVAQALVVFFLFLRAVFFFRGFLSFGALIFIVVEVFYTMLPFITLLAVLTIGFTFAMEVLNRHIFTAGEVWTNEFRPFFFMLNYGMRFAPPGGDFLATVSRRPVIGLFYLLFMFSVQLVLLNLLVAIMSNKLGQLRGSERLMASHVRAKLVIDLEQVLLTRILHAHGSAQSVRKRATKAVGSLAKRAETAFQIAQKRGRLCSVKTVSFIEPSSQSSWCVLTTVRRPRSIDHPTTSATRSRKSGSTV